MFPALMATFACVMAAAALVGVRLTMRACADGVRRMDSMMEQHRASVNVMDARIERSANATLHAELDDLRAALDVIRASNRKEFGSLWGRMGGKPRETEQPQLGNGAMLAANDDSFVALLELQSAPPVKPQ